MRRPKNYKIVTTTFYQEVIVIDSDTDTDTDTNEVGDRTLALCGEVNASCEFVNTLAEDGEKNRPSMQIVCADDCHSGLDSDLEYKKYLSTCTPNHLYMLEQNMRNSSPMCLMFSVDKASDRKKGRLVKTEKMRAKRKSKPPSMSIVSERLMTENGRAGHKLTSIGSESVTGRKESVTGRKAKSPLISSVSKRLKSDNGRSDHKLVSGKKEKRRAGRKPKFPSRSTVSKKLETENGRRPDHKLISVKKEKSRAVRKSKPPSVSSGSKILKTENGRADHKLISWTVYRTKETQLKKRDACQGMKKTWKEENKDNSERRIVKSQMISRASKRLKTENGCADYNSISRTIPGINAKDTQQKKREDPQGRKILVTKKKVESKSISHNKDSIHHSFKARKKVNEEGLSSLDRSYAYHLASQRNSITIFKPDQPVKPVKDLVCLSDPDIIAISNHPFSDGCNIPFQTDKDDKVLDLEDGMEPDNLFNSVYSKKLMKVLSKPYDENERLNLHYAVKFKRPVTRSRELRDGREFEYNVTDQLRPSYLEMYTDFKKKFRRHWRDSPRALNLLRGFFFYFENIALEGAFKPWAYEKRLENMCFDARECKDVKCIEAAPHCS